MAGADDSKRLVRDKCQHLVQRNGVVGKADSDKPQKANFDKRSDKQNDKPMHCHKCLQI